MGTISTIVGAVTDFVSGNAFKAAKDLVTAYLPPDMSDEKKREFELKFEELAQRKAAEAAALANAQLALELQDTQQARVAHQLSIMPAVVTVILSLMASGLLYAVIFIELKPGSQNLALTLFGTVFTLWGASIQFWVGTTRSSQDKDRIIASNTK